MYASRIRHSVADQERLTIEDASVAQHGDGRYSLWFTTSDGNVHKTCVRYSSQNGFAVTDIRRDAEDIGDGEDRTGGTKLQEERVFHLSEARPSSLCMSPDRRFLLVGLMDGQLVSVDADLHSSTLLGRVRSGAPIVSIAYDDHHCCFWVCSADLAITAWDANTLVPLCSVAMQPPEELRREDPFAARVRFMNRLIIVSTGTALLNAMLPQQCVDALKAPRPQRQNLPAVPIRILDDWFCAGDSGSGDGDGDDSTGHAAMEMGTTPTKLQRSASDKPAGKAKRKAAPSKLDPLHGAQLHQSVSASSSFKHAKGRAESDAHMAVNGCGRQCSGSGVPVAHAQLHTLFRHQSMAVHSFVFGREQEVWCGSHVSACLFVYDIGMRKVLLSWLLPCTGITAIAHHGGSMWVGTKEGMTYAWDATTHAPLMQISFHTDMVRCFAGIGKVLVSVSASGDSSVVFCDTAEMLRRKHNCTAASSAVVEGNAKVPEYAVDRYGFYRLHVRTNMGPMLDDSAKQEIRAATQALPESFVSKHSVLLEQAALSLEDIARCNSWDELCAYARAHSLDESVSGAEVDQIRAIIMEKKHMFRLGIPEEHRVTMWRFLVRLRTHSIRKFKKVGYYRRMLAYKGTSQTPFPQAGQIEVDLRRTFPNNIHFQSKEQPLMQALDRVLRAFGWHNPRVGYCQGFGMIAGFALLVLEEEDAFWALTTIVEDIMTFQYYSSQLVEAQIDMDVLDALMAHYLPELHRHFHNIGMNTTCYYKWFIPAFVDVLPAYVTFLVWDAFFLEEREILFRFALAIFQYHYDALIKTPDDCAFHAYMKTELKATTNVQRLLSIAYGWDDISEVIKKLSVQGSQTVTERLGSEAR